MSNLVSILAALCASAAALARVPRWRTAESRPFTLGLVFLAVWALLWAPAITDAATALTLPSGHFEALPGLAADLSLVAAGGLIGVAMADAWGRPRLEKSFYVGMIVVAAALLLTYDPLHPSDGIVEAHKWILAVAGLLGNLAVLAPVTLGYRAVPAPFRLPLGLFIFGGAAGVVLAVARIVTLLRPDGWQLESWAPILATPVFGFALGSLVASARTEPVPADDI
ncbi:hypothetical protein [Nocardia sp. NBC_00511]|uniref:hypothetical protein n=1 Tax=Nocardia sp. NBC_00511 TaxID=2903591 RepID=UPI0030E08B99